jgi:hypothetical protein
MTIWWPQPVSGDIVWCRFALMGPPAPKARPALIMAVADNGDSHFDVKVAYGTSQKVNQLFAGEFAIGRDGAPAAYAAAGLSYDTKFDFNQARWLPFNSDWFGVPPARPYGHSPQLGVMHASVYRAAAAAHQAAGSP